MTSSPADTSWTQILDRLTSKARAGGTVKAVKNASGFQDKIRVVQDTFTIRRKCLTWISQCGERYQKNGGTASKLRDEGNLKFRAHDIRGSLKLYTESVIIAPESSPELSLAFGNRSAALYHSSMFQDCIQDVDLALKHRFPKNMEYKLHQRKGQCLMKLGEFDRARKSFQLAIEALQFVPKLTQEKKDFLHKDIQALLTETDSLENQGHSRQGTTDGHADVVVPDKPLGGESHDRPGMSSALRVDSDATRGRHVVATADVNVGDVLFAELPYASVLLPEHYATHCHHCYRLLDAPIPCLKCTQPRYCSEACRHESWQQYHVFECHSLDLLHSVGVAHLALRVVLVAGMKKLLALRPFLDKKQLSVASTTDPYANVLSLAQHSDSLHPEDLFQYSVTASLLSCFLEQRTTFFSVSGDSLEKSFERASLEKPDEEVTAFVGGLILKHIVQLVCNASAIYEVGGQADNSSFDDEDSTVYNNSQVRIATAIYPQASMMNHSCSPSVINSFYRNRIIVRAIQKLSAGQEVFNCYGPHFRRQPKKDRLEVLRSQYGFVCTCEYCTSEKNDDFHDRVLALQCKMCRGPIQNPRADDSLKHEMPCMDCGTVQDYSKQIESVFIAHGLYTEGLGYMSYGDFANAIPVLQSCYQLRSSAMYAHHREVSEVADQLAKCYATMGNFYESAQFIKVCLPAIEERFGSNSLEMAHEIVKLVDVLVGDMQDTTKSIPRLQEKIAEARICLEKASTIFELHYGQWNKHYQEIQQKLLKLDLLNKH